MHERAAGIAIVTGVVLLLAAAFVVGLTLGWTEGREDLAKSLAQAHVESEDRVGTTYLFYNSSTRGYVVGGMLAVLGLTALSGGSWAYRRQTGRVGVSRDEGNV